MTNTDATSVPPTLIPALKRLTRQAEENAVGSEEFENASVGEVADARVVAEGLAKIGIEVSPKVAYQVWSLVSENYQAGWLDGPRNVEDASQAVLGLCRDIADEADYAGFSGKGQ